MRRQSITDRKRLFQVTLLLRSCQELILQGSKVWVYFLVALLPQKKRTHAVNSALTTCCIPYNQIPFPFALITGPHFSPTPRVSILFYLESVWPANALVLTPRFNNFGSDSWHFARLWSYHWCPFNSLLTTWCPRQLPLLSSTPCPIHSMGPSEISCPGL